MWEPHDSGKTIGQTGSEDGVIIADEEHSDGARITLEVDGHFAPYSITCGIYGTMVHTAFAADRTEATVMFDAMKAELERVLAGGIDWYVWVDQFVKQF